MPNENIFEIINNLIARKKDEATSYLDLLSPQPTIAELRAIAQSMGASQDHILALSNENIVDDDIDTQLLLDDHDAKIIHYNALGGHYNSLKSLDVNDMNYESPEDYLAHGANPMLIFKEYANICQSIASATHEKANQSEILLSICLAALNLICHTDSFHEKIGLASLEQDQFINMKTLCGVISSFDDLLSDGTIYCPIPLVGTSNILKAEIDEIDILLLAANYSSYLFIYATLTYKLANISEHDPIARLSYKEALKTVLNKAYAEHQPINLHQQLFTHGILYSITKLVSNNILEYNILTVNAQVNLLLSGSQILNDQNKDKITTGLVALLEILKNELKDNDLFNEHSSKINDILQRLSTKSLWLPQNLESLLNLDNWSAGSAKKRLKP